VQNTFHILHDEELWSKKGHMSEKLKDEGVPRVAFLAFPNPAKALARRASDKSIGT
jgi:hypothetical protein